MNINSETRIDFVVRHLRLTMPKHWEKISIVSGVPKKTIHKIAYLETRDPRSSTLDALYLYFDTENKAALMSQIKMVCPWCKISIESKT
jgi:hypothetical protein